MNNDTKPNHDVFTFSLNGMRAVGGYMSIPVVADDSLDSSCESHKDAPAANDKPKRRTLWRRRKAA